MDPCPFIRLSVDSLALQPPSPTRAPGAAASGVHPSSTPCYAKLTFGNFPSQTAPVPLCAGASSTPESSTSAPGYHLNPSTLQGLSRSGKPLILTLKVSVFTGRMGRTCGIPCGRGSLLGSVQVCVNLEHAQTKACLHQNGWMKLCSRGGEPAACLHMTLRSEPDPRFVFQFGGEPECNPVVFQIQGNIRQPVFSCKFRADGGHRSRSLPCDFNGQNRWWLRTFSGEKDRAGGRERKGWMITVYDLSGSAIAAASMITPFVPSQGTDRVSRSNPGAWLILRPNGVSVSNSSSWKPWGRLEAWRERGPIDGLGYKFELVTSSGNIPITEGTMNVNKGGRFCIDRAALSPVHGFVMESSVEGEGKESKPAVQVGFQHVACMADAALFIALSAAVDLSMDACRLFSHKLRKELSSVSPS